MLRKLQPPTGVAARFDDDRCDVGTVELPDRRVICLLNWTDAPRSLSFTLPRAAQVRDLWAGNGLGRSEGRVSVFVGGHDGRLLECRTR